MTTEISRLLRGDVKGKSAKKGAKAVGAAVRAKKKK